jgi:hypothetical protein
MKPHRPTLLGLVLFASLSFVPAADAQILPRWFGPKSSDKNLPTKSTQSDPRRLTEVNVEVAWLADPVTFPYYLEAHAIGGQLEVRGYVPDKTVREHALRIAQVYSSLPVADSLKEHPSLLVRPSQMSPQQLQGSVLSSLRVALPKQYQQLKAECGSEGKVYVVGMVNTCEEKMAVSHALRRLHGCTSVQNLTTLPSEMAQNPPRAKTPIVKTSNSTEQKSDKPVVAQENKSKSWWPFNLKKGATDEPPLLDPRKPALKNKEPVIVDAEKPLKPDGPILIPSQPEVKEKSRPAPEVIKVELPSPGPKTPLTRGELEKRIQAFCPQVKSVEVQFTSAKEVAVTLEIRSENELKSVAERVFEMPELQNYRAELQFKISAP